jgi:hypothetical protein
MVMNGNKNNNAMTTSEDVFENLKLNPACDELINCSSYSIYSDQEDDETDTSPQLNSSNYNKSTQLQAVLSSSPGSLGGIGIGNSNISTPSQIQSQPIPPPVPPRVNRAPPPLPPKLHPITARLDQSLCTPNHIHCSFDNALSIKLKEQYPNRICGACQTSDHSMYNYATLWAKAQQKATQLYGIDTKMFNDWFQQKLAAQQLQQQQQQ